MGNIEVDTQKEYWQQGMYSEEEIEVILIKYSTYLLECKLKDIEDVDPLEWFEQNKK